LALIMTRNRTLTATFAINAYTLTVTTVGSGAVTKSPNLASYDHGTAVTVTATPDPGYHFVGWSGDTTTSTNPLTLTMIANQSVTATFAINTYTLSITTVGTGTVAKSPDQPAYDHGTAVQLTATPGTGYHFIGWSGDTTTSTNPVTVAMIGNKSITATFAINTYTLTVTSGPNGSAA